MNKLLIWDIDGTILDCKGCGRNALSMTFQELYGYENAFAEVDLTGKIDIEVIDEIVNHYEVKNFNKEIFSLQYGRNLKYIMEKTDGIGLIDGVENFLKEISKKEHFYLSIATGNCKTGAKGKLSYCSINDYFRTGAYGDEANNRKELVAIAIENAKIFYEVDFSKENIYYFGDTPKDIEAAKFNKIKSVALSTGSYAYDVLKEHQPDFIFCGLHDIVDLYKIFK